MSAVLIAPPPLPSPRAADLTARPRTSDDLIAWAAGHAGRLLTEQPTRWRHTQQVVVHAWWTAAGLDPRERELLVAAAYLHDIGYAAELEDTGFHPLDGARWLARQGQPELARLVAHHSGASLEARHRGLSDALAEFPPLEGTVADALTFCDVTAGPGGDTVDPGPRFAEIVSRHGRQSIVARSRAEARAHMYAAVVRTLRRVTQARPTRNRSGVHVVHLGCTRLLRLTGSLDTDEAVSSAVRALRRTAAEGAHVLLCDLLLLDVVSAAGAGRLVAEAGRTRLQIRLLQPSPAVLAVLATASQAGKGRRWGVTDDVLAAVTPHCG